MCRVQNANFWLVCIAYSMSVSIYGVWSSLFGVILKDVMDEVIEVIRIFAAIIVPVSSSSIASDMLHYVVVYVCSLRC